MFKHAIVLLGATVLWSCGGETNPQASCGTPGEVQFCPCVGGSQGTQVCQESGAWGACACGNTTPTPNNNSAIPMEGDYIPLDPPGCESSDCGSAEVDRPLNPAATGGNGGNTCLASPTAAYPPSISQSYKSDHKAYDIIGTKVYAMGPGEVLSGKSTLAGSWDCYSKPLCYGSTQCSCESQGDGTYKTVCAEDATNLAYSGGSYSYSSGKLCYRETCANAGSCSDSSLPCNNQVMIEFTGSNGGTYRQTVLHIEEMSVQPGDRVEAGQEIATVGNVGWSCTQWPEGTGNHAHVILTEYNADRDTFEYSASNWMDWVEEDCEFPPSPFGPVELLSPQPAAQVTAGDLLEFQWRDDAEATIVRLRVSRDINDIKTPACSSCVLEEVMDAARGVGSFRWSSPATLSPGTYYWTLRQGAPGRGSEFTPPRTLIVDGENPPPVCNHQCEATDPNVCNGQGNVESCQADDQGCRQLVESQSCMNGCSGGRCEQEACTAKTCSSAGAECGELDDGCGNTVQCGSCSGGARCRNGSCECDSQDYQSCRSGDLWWFDSCGNPGSLAMGCPSGCSNDRCLTCIEECQTASPTYRDPSSTEVAQPNGGLVIRLRVTDASDCQSLKLRADKTNGDLGPGNYFLRVGSCKEFGAIRDTATLSQAAGFIDFETTYSGAVGDDKLFCVTKQDLGAPDAVEDAWFYSNLAMLEKVEVCN